MLVLLTVPLSEIKSYVLVLPFYIKMMKQRTLQACNSRHSTKKDIAQKNFSVWGKLDLFKPGMGGVLPPSSPPFGYAPVSKQLPNGCLCKKVDVLEISVTIIKRCNFANYETSKLNVDV